MTTKNDRAAKIAALNDAFRTTLSPATGRVVCTSGVSANGPEFVAKALAAVKSFDGFTVDNDSHQERDFGSFDIKGEKLFWKIDYYCQRMKFGSQDPADPNQTTRVLTLMLAEEY